MKGMGAWVGGVTYSGRGPGDRLAGMYASNYHDHDLQAPVLQGLIKTQSAYQTYVLVGMTQTYRFAGIESTSERRELCWGAPVDSPVSPNA